MVFPGIWERFSFTNLISRKSNEVLSKGYQKNNFWGDLIIGASLGPIFSACSPTYFVILATVLPATPILGIIYLLVYVLGLCLALLFIAFIGQRIMNKIGVVSDSRGWFKRIFGIIFILVAIAILTGADKKLQIKILDSGFLDVTKIEQKLLEENDKQKEETSINADGQSTSEDVVNNDNNVPQTNQTDNKVTYLTLAQKAKKYTYAPDISTPDGFINTDGKPITISEFKGKKVVLLDIWTYSCINCQRTLPYLNQWYKTYEDEGLVIIGLHTPEFSFEKVQKNVENAVKDFGIKYPVVLDNDFSTWTAYKNQYWPRKYLIDIDGYIVYDHAGEGDYGITEKRIQEALKERAARLDMKEELTTGISNPSGVVSVEPGKVNSPETYFGAFRNELLSNGKIYTTGDQSFKLPIIKLPNRLYLEGTWNIASEYAENKNSSTIYFDYDAKNVYMVASSPQGIEVEIYIDDVLSKKINIKNEQLYTIVSGDTYGKHKLHIKIPESGLKAFTFTFG